MRWKVTNPLGDEVVLRELTFKEHILGDHYSADAAFRAALEPAAKFTVTNPHLIIDDNGRHLYYRLTTFIEEDDVKVKILKVVIDTDRTPHGVVTWTTARKGDAVKKGAVIYEFPSI